MLIYLKTLFTYQDVSVLQPKQKIMLVNICVELDLKSNPPFTESYFFVCSKGCYIFNQCLSTCIFYYNYLAITTSLQFPKAAKNT